MNKRSFLLSACTLAIASTIAMAQDSVIWLDVRPNDTSSGVKTITGNLGASGANPFNNDTVGAGRRGQGQILRIEPQHADGYESADIAGGTPAIAYPNFDGDANRSTGDLWIYMDVFDDASGTDDVISSIGLNVDLQPAGTVMRAKPSNIALTLDNGNTVFNSMAAPAGSPSPWNNKVDGNIVAASDPLDWEKAKAVRVPVDTGPTYNASLGIVPRATGPTDKPYRLGKLRVTAGARNCTQRVAGLGTFGGHAQNSAYNVFLRVNNLLITRVYNGGGDTQENVSFGYNALEGGTVPETPAVNGNDSVTGVSAVPDARIEIRVKGDFNNDGNVTSADNTAFGVAAFSDSTDNQWQAYNGSFNADNVVTSADIGVVGLGGAGYLGAQTRSTTCP